MPDRVSLIEQYDNRDVIAQIYRIIDIAEHGAIETLTATKEGSVVKLIFTMHDGTKHEITFEANGIKDVYAVQSGSTETIHVVLDDDTEKTFAFDIAIAGVTTDTQQTITARKTFTAPQTFSGGIEGTTMIDGDVQVSNGHSLSVAGDIDTAGDLQVAGNAEFLGNVEAGGMAIEESNGRTVLSNPNGLRMEGQLSLDAMTVAGMTISKSVDRVTVMGNDDPILIPNALRVRTNATGTRDSEAVNGNRLQNDLDAYSQMMRLTGNQTAKGLKSGNFSVKEFPVGIPTPANSGKYRLLYKIKGLTETSIGIRLTVQDVSNTTNIYLAIIQAIVSESFNGVAGTKLESKTPNYVDIPTDICFGYKKGEIDIWYKATQYRPKSIVIDRITSYGNILQPDIDIFGEVYADDYTTYDSYLFTGVIQ